MTGTLQIAKQKCRGSLSSTLVKAPQRHKAERVMGLEPTISCLGSTRSTTELHPRSMAGIIRQAEEACQYVIKDSAGPRRRSGSSWELTDSA